MKTLSHHRPEEIWNWNTKKYINSTFFSCFSDDNLTCVMLSGFRIQWFRQVWVCYLKDHRICKAPWNSLQLVWKGISTTFEMDPGHKLCCWLALESRWMMSSLSYLREAYVIHQERRLSRVLPSATPIVQLEFFFRPLYLSRQTPTFQLFLWRLAYEVRT